MSIRETYICHLCGKEETINIKNPEEEKPQTYGINFTQPGELLEEGLCYDICETCYQKMFEHLTKISNIGKEEKKKEDISCGTCRHLSNTDTEVYCKMNHPIVGGLGNTCCSEWKSKTHSHENPAT